LNGNKFESLAIGDLSYREQKRRDERISHKVGVNDPDQAKAAERKERLNELLETSVLGSHDTGDPNTTNLYVGNLSPQVSACKTNLGLV